MRDSFYPEDFCDPPVQDMDDYEQYYDPEDEAPYPTTIVDNMGYAWLWCYLMETGCQPVVNTLYLSADHSSPNYQIVKRICNEYVEQEGKIIRIRDVKMIDPFTVMREGEVVLNITDETEVALITESILKDYPPTDTLPF